MRNLLITSTILLTSCFCNKLSDPNTLIDFNGQVLARVPKHWRVDITHPLKAELTLMKQDSTILKKFITKDDGTFNESININTKWNPLILKIKGLENLRIDTLMTERNAIGYKLSCTKTKSNYQK